MDYSKVKTGGKATWTEEITTVQGKKKTLRKKDWYKKYRFDKLSKWLNDKKKLNLEN